MAVTFLTGFETRLAAADGGAITGTASISQTQARTGTSALRCNPASGAAGYFAPASNPVVGQFIHFGLYIVTAPSIDRVIAGSSTSAGFMTVRLRSDRKLSVFISTTLIGTSTTALSTGTWYWIGYREKTGTSVDFLQIDGTTEVTGTATVSSAGNGQIGFRLTEASAAEIYIDDLIIDDTGFLASSKVIDLLPISDNGAVTGWACGDGTTTTNLWEAVNNQPPAGVASASETATTNIESLSSVGGTYTANLQSYTTGGVGASDTIIGVQTIIRHGEDIATGTKTGTGGDRTNPTDTGLAFNFGGDAGAHAAEVGLWANVNFGVTTGGALSGITLGTSPTLAVVRPNQARVGCVDYMALRVGWTPGAPPADAPPKSDKIYPQLLAQ